MRKTKIVCTIGPASSNPTVLEQLFNAGMNVARLNFSHGTHEGHKKVIENIRALSAKLDVHVAIIQDISGPKVRIGAFKDEQILLKADSRFTLTCRDIVGDESQVGVNYKNLPDDVEVGDTILLSDGNIQLKVVETTSTDINCSVVVGGVLSSHKGINLPTATMDVPPLTPKDREDLKFGIAQGVDYIALSFVRQASDIEILKEIIRNEGANIPVIAKIEKHEALVNIDDIISIVDGIMVARGDLGVEIPFEQVPLMQKMLVRKCNAAGKPVITATQMLMSMVNNPRPTRAEVTDIANAVLDGTDALMLSEETAMGNYPVEAVSVMSRIAVNTESSAEFINFMRKREMPERATIPDAISHAASVTAQSLGSAAIITPTSSGSTARMIARYRPAQQIIAISAHSATVARLSLIWGVVAVVVDELLDTDDMTKKARDIARKMGLVKSGDTVVITAGVPIGVEGTTNLIKVEVF